MAKQISAIKFVGKLGNIVGSRGIDGKAILREKAASVANPQTEDQMNQRARMSLSAKVAGMLGEVGKLALKANGYKSTRRGTLIKDILQDVTIISDQKAGLPKTLSLVKNPVVSPFSNDVTVATTIDGTTIAGTLTGLPEGTLTAKALLIFDKNLQQWFHISSLDTATELLMRVPNAENVDVYFYAEVVVPRTSAGKARLDQLIGENPGYTISVSRLDASNFGYSRTLNASIVDGQESTDTYDAQPTTQVETTVTLKGELGTAVKPYLYVNGEDIVLGDPESEKPIAVTPGRVTIEAGGVDGTVFEGVSLTGNREDVITPSQGVVTIEVEEGQNQDFYIVWQE